MSEGVNQLGWTNCITLCVLFISCAWVGTVFIRELFK